MPEPAPPSNVGLYRAGVTSPERLRHTSVAREHLLDDAIESLRGSVKRKSKNHLLFIGPRGIGKTHLLSRIEDAVRSDEALGTRVVVVRFPEESNRTLSFADFLIGMCGILKEVLEDEPRWAELFAAVETEEDDARVADTLVPAFREENRRRGRTLLVMLENLGEVLGRQIRVRNEVAALRKFLMADNGCLLMATAPVHFDGITDVEQPFYDFFDVQILEALSFEETVEVIRLNLEWEGRTAVLGTLEGMRPRLHALYRMTGGNPRLTMMLYELLAHESVTGVQNQFHLLLDRISPFYQGRLNDLPPGQRALLECLASMRDREKTPAAIAARMRMSQQETSSLLKRLSDARYLRAVQHPRDRRSRLYTIREGFFDIWLAMNLSRGARRRMPFLLDFFSFFYPSVEAREEKRRKLRAKLLEDGGADAETALDYLSEVGDAGERATSKFDMARIFASAGARADGELHIGSHAAGGRRREPVDCSHRRERSTHSRLSRRNRGDDRGLGDAPERRVRGVRPTARGDGGGADPPHVLRDQAGLSPRCAGKRGGCRKTNRTAPENRERADGPRTMESPRSSNAKRLPRQRNLETRSWSHGRQATWRICSKAPTGLRKLNRCCGEALAIDEAAYGERHPTVAIRLNNLACLLKDTNGFAEVEPLLRRALRSTRPPWRTAPERGE